MERHGAVSYPISTDDLTILIEQEAGDLDYGANLDGEAQEGAEIEGVTYFSADRPPRVEISRRLSENPKRLARLRTTLAHELGHVLLHDVLRKYPDETATAEPAGGKQPVAACAPSFILGNTRVDWMEWQANYACGALLMPRNAVKRLVQVAKQGRGPVKPAATGTSWLLDLLVVGFLVSETAANVRREI